MHKVFIENKPLVFEDIYNEVPKKEGSLQILSDSEYSIDNILDKMKDESISGIIYLSANPDRLWSEFADRFVLVEAAGGVVRNEKEEILAIYRKKRWDLPKGKLDYNESPASAALREVKEECGVKTLEMERFLMKTFHVYTEKKKTILKKTHWYTMTSSDEKLTPQTEEEIELAEWMDRERVYSEFFGNTYAAIKDVLGGYFGT